MKNVNKILYIHQYFITPDQPGGTRSYWIAKEMVSQGYRVTMLTSNSDGDNKVKQCEIDGIKVIYLPNKYSQNMGVLRRFYSFISFMFKASIYALKEKEVDLIYATSTPLTIGIPALLCRWFKKIPFIFEVRDLWPEVPIQLGALNNKFLQWVAISLEKIIYKNALWIIALSPDMEKGVNRFGSTFGKTSMVPNMSKLEEFKKERPKEEIIKRFNVDKSIFNVVHFGSMGIANGLDYIIKAAKISEDNNNPIHYHFLGAGQTEEELKKMSKKLDLNNVFFHGPQPMKLVSDFLDLCDVSLVSFANYPILKSNSPNKLFDSLSAGIPLVVNSAGWTKEMVEKEKCGVYVDPNSPKDLAEKLELLRNSPELLVSYRQNARKLAEEKYDKKILCRQIMDKLKDLDRHV
ncbi:glycosyltransferase family 4 protein [Nonlabens tegetincola]|uniref:glycosyltransferase family 4 protein n=1 Tax=Nonlabens tegetincola TaxID=323273 RepID=UPI000CF47051|nr:glycosyltransferase family 4 protein [Nonlabens tegetincola]PQJ18524.1 hypothetical protein BST93_08545 [Nonlabens tegetincola]